MAKKNVFFILSAVIIGIVAAAVLLLKNNQTVDLNAQNYHNGVKEKNEKDKSFWGSKSGSRECSSEPVIFRNPLTDIKNISKITPGSRTGDPRYTYLWIMGGSSIPVFAPADGKLVKISYKVRTDLPPSMSKPDYDLVFQADCHTTFVINHITDPRPDIEGTKPIAEPIQLKPGSGVNDKDTIPTNEIMVKAGEQIGTTTGTPSARNFDFGVFTDNEAICPYEKFNEPIRSSWLGLFRGVSCQVSGHI